MATTSEVKTALYEISDRISRQRERYQAAKDAIEDVSAQLGAIPDDYQDELDTIDGYAPDGSFETLAVDEKDRLTTEYDTLKTKVDDLIATDEFSA